MLRIHSVIGRVVKGDWEEKSKAQSAEETVGTSQRKKGKKNPIDDVEGPRRAGSTPTQGTR